MRESVGALAAVAVAFSLVGTAICRADAPGVENALPTIFRRMTAEPYELDAHPRYVDGAKFRCPQPETVAYRGTTIRYRPTVRVHRAFRERLERFEALVAKVGKRYYGRAPFRLVHSGGFNCRRVRGSSVRISEHALGNALDLRGFDFPHIGARASKRLGLPRRYGRSFRVRVAEHWNATRPRDRRHSEFLHALADAVRNEPDVFRGVVGPGWPRHDNHLHFDVAPWGYALYER